MLNPRKSFFAFSCYIVLLHSISSSTEGIGRILGAQILSDGTKDCLFTSATTTAPVYDWSPWENAPTMSKISLDKWTFIAQSVDVDSSTQYGFRYVLDAAAPAAPTSVLNSRSPSSGSFYKLYSNATVVYTNDPHGGSPCGCKMQYIRVYTDYFPSTQDQMISLALMNPISK